MQLPNCDFVTMMKYHVLLDWVTLLSLERSSDSDTAREEIESKVFVGMLPLVPPFIESKTINNASPCNFVFCECEYCE